MQDCELVTADAPKRSVEQPATIVGASFSRSGRLLKHSDFDRVYKQGRRHFSSHLTVFYLRRTEGAAAEVSPGTVSPENGTRIGLTVGRALGGAVDRNRIKRRLREAVRQRRTLLADLGAADLVINPKKSVLTLDFSVVLQEVGQAFEAVAKKLAKSAGNKEIKSREIKK
ncbi:MAG: ribonuclease P protein component [Terriglobales bacterium]